MFIKPLYSLGICICTHVDTRVTNVMTTAVYPTSIPCGVSLLLLLLLLLLLQACERCQPAT